MAERAPGHHGPGPRTRGRRAGGRMDRLSPWIALVGLFVCHHVASAARWDVKDSHDRLDRIYKELGIEQHEESAGGCMGSPPEEKKPKKEREGCGCRPATSPETPRRAAVRAPAMPAGLGYVLIGVILAAMLIPLFFVLKGSLAEERSAPGQLPDDDEETAQPAKQRGPWRVDLGECRTLLQKGELALAFAALHRLTLLALARRQELTLDESTTNWEYVRRLISKPALKQMLAAVTLAAEQSVLGKRPPPAEHYDRLERMVLQAVEEAPT